MIKKNLSEHNLEVPNDDLGVDVSVIDPGDSCKEGIEMGELSLVWRNIKIVDE
jgi:hypothetical protein